MASIEQMSLTLESRQSNIEDRSNVRISELEFVSFFSQAEVE